MDCVVDVAISSPPDVSTIASAVPRRLLFSLSHAGTA